MSFLSEIFIGTIQLQSIRKSHFQNLQFFQTILIRYLQLQSPKGYGRRSTRTSSSFSEMSKRRSSTRPSTTFFSLTRINVLPLPGLTWRKSMTKNSLPSIRMQVPILMSCELIIAVYIIVLLIIRYDGLSCSLQSFVLSVIFIHGANTCKQPKCLSVSVLRRCKVTEIHSIMSNGRLFFLLLYVFREKRKAFFQKNT